MIIMTDHENKYFEKNKKKNQHQIIDKDRGF